MSLRLLSLPETPLRSAPLSTPSTSGPPILVHHSCDHPHSNAASSWVWLDFWHLDVHHSLPPPPGSSLQFEWAPPSCSMNGFHPLGPRPAEAAWGSLGHAACRVQAGKPGPQVSKSCSSLSLYQCGESGSSQSCWPQPGHLRGCGRADMLPGLELGALLGPTLILAHLPSLALLPPNAHLGEQ